MAKAELNSGLKTLRGDLDGFVFKQYGDKVVVSRRPRMDQIKPSPAQQAQRKRFHAAAKFHREVLADPALKQHYETLAEEQSLPLSAVTLAAYMRQVQDGATTRETRQPAGG